MEVRQFALEQDVIMIGTRDIARATGARTATIEGLMHGGEHRRMLPHSEIVVGTPDRDFLLSAIGMKCRPRKAPCFPLEVSENSVSPFPAKRFQPLAKIRLVIHGSPEIIVDTGATYLRG